MDPSDRRICAYCGYPIIRLGRDDRRPIESGRIYCLGNCELRFRQFIGSVLRQIIQLLMIIVAAYLYGWLR